MESQNEKHINHFCGFFSNKVTSISGGDFSELANVYKRLLLCCVLDALARATFPKELKNKERFSRLVRDHGNWPDCNKVSLTHLRKLLSHADAIKDQRFTNIRKSVDLMPSQSTHNDFFLKEDPFFSYVDNLWPKLNGIPVKLGKLWAKDIRHDCLFYSFRNNLVHEFNASEVRGYPTPEEPYYLRGRHELHYPTEFIATLARNVIKNIEQYFKMNNINPHASFLYGPFLIEELNGA